MQDPGEPHPRFRRLPVHDKLCCDMKGTIPHIPEDETEYDEQGRRKRYDISGLPKLEPGPDLYDTKNGYVLNAKGERVDPYGRLWYPRGCAGSMRSRGKNRPNPKMKHFEKLLLD